MGWEYKHVQITDAVLNSYLNYMGKMNWECLSITPGNHRCWHLTFKRPTTDKDRG